MTPLALKIIGDLQILRNCRTQETSTAEAESLVIGEHIFERPLLTVVNTEAPSRALGTRVDGILGNDILGEISFKMNYSEQELVLAPLSQLENLTAPVQLRQSGKARLDSAEWTRLAATDLAWRPRARDEASRGGRLPWLVGLGLWCSCGSRRGLGRSSSLFCRSVGPRGSCLCVVLIETAMFVFAARAAMTGLVAPRSCTGRSSH